MLQAATDILKVENLNVCKKTCISLYLTLFNEVHAVALHIYCTICRLILFCEIFYFAKRNETKYNEKAGIMRNDSS